MQRQTKRRAATHTHTDSEPALLERRRAVAAAAAVLSRANKAGSKEEEEEGRIMGEAEQSIERKEQESRLKIRRY